MDQEFKLKLDDRPVPEGTLARGIAILEVLANNASGAHLHAIADALHVPRSATHRLLTELGELGYVRQDAERGRYRLTAKIVSVGSSFLANLGVVDLVQPILDHLARLTGELVRLALIDSDRLTWVAKAQGASIGLRYDPDMGAETSLYCTATGFAWLSCLSDGEALRLIEAQRARLPFEGGPNAPRSTSDVLDCLNQARRRGYGISFETFAAGMSAIAAPVRRKGDGQAKAVVSIAGPCSRLSEMRLHELAPDLLTAVAELSVTSFNAPGFHAQNRANMGDIFEDTHR